MAAVTAGLGRRRFRFFAIAVACLVALPARATQYWELTPGPDPRVAVGTYTVAKGATAPEGVNFTLKNNTLDNPVQLMLVATKPGAALHLSAFSDGEPFLEKDTDQTGVVTVRFRTGNDMNFKVTGPAGATYQIALWRGPKIILPISDPIVAMDKAEEGGTSSTHTMAPAPMKVASPAAPSSSSATSNTLIYVLLAGIFAALVVIAGLIYRGQTMRGKP